MYKKEALTMKKRIRQVVLGILLLVLLAIAGFGVLYAGRLRTVNSIEQLTNYDDYNLYRMDIRYDYSIDDVINYGITDNQSMINAILKEALPLLPVKMKAPQFGCSAFGTVLDRHIVMGRNYDFKRDTSAMLVYCAPKNGYKSVALTALDNISANELDANLKKKLACLTAPFICLDGMNEKGVSIAVLTLDSEPVNQSTGKQKIFTTLAIRLVLDRAATTQEAVDLLNSYDMFATSGRDYHFFVVDASGDARVLEYDPEQEGRPLRWTAMQAITNFYGCYAYLVKPNQRNGIYGHGKERYDAIMEVLAMRDPDGDIPADIAWKALQAAAQDPSPNDVTSNTQWSLVYDDTDLTTQIVIRRKWGDVIHYDLNTNEIDG